MMVCSWLRQAWLARALATVLLGGAAVAGAKAQAAEVIRHGEDVYASGEAASLERDSGRNAFLAGGSVEMDADTARDAHVAGFDVDMEGAVGGDLYVAGALVSVAGPVSGDATLAGYSITVPQPSRVAGNLRAMARSVAIDGSVGGAALVTAGELTLNGTIAGDLLFAGRTIDFGPDARVEGRLTYRTPEAVEVPASVAAPDRVTWERLAPEHMARGFGDGEWFEPPSAVTIVAVAAAAFLALLLVGILFLGLFPRTIEGLRAEIETRMWRSLGFGLIGLATLLGLVPLAVVSVVGLPLVPVIVPAIGLVSLFAWLLGAYTLAHRVFQSFGAGLASTGMRLVAFLVGVIVLAALNAVPFLGWLLNAFAALIGFGALQMRLVERLDRATRRGSEAVPADGSPG